MWYRTCSGAYNAVNDDELIHGKETAIACANEGRFTNAK